MRSNEPRVNSTWVELSAVSTRHEQNWAPCQLDTLLIVAIRHSITVQRVVNAITTGHDASTHVHNYAPCRLDMVTLLTTWHQGTMYRISCAQMIQRKSTVHCCDCVPVADWIRLQLDRVATRQRSYASASASESAFKTMQLRAGFYSTFHSLRVSFIPPLTFCTLHSIFKTS